MKRSWQSKWAEYLQSQSIHILFMNSKVFNYLPCFLFLFSSFWYFEPNETSIRNKKFPETRISGSRSNWITFVFASVLNNFIWIWKCRYHPWKIVCIIFQVSNTFSLYIAEEANWKQYWVKYFALVISNGLIVHFQRYHDIFWSSRYKYDYSV